MKKSPRSGWPSGERDDTVRWLTFDPPLRPSGVFCALLGAQLTRGDSSLRTAAVTCQRNGGEESAFKKIFFHARRRKRFQRRARGAREK